MVLVLVLIGRESGARFFNQSLSVVNAKPKQTQLTFDTQVKTALKDLDLQSLKQFGVTQGLQWIFSSADAPWQNGVSEALIKSIKKAITIAIGENVMTFSELQTVCFEAANLVNERPIGKHPTSPDDESYLCPNDLLLGRSTSRVPSGPFAQTDIHGAGTNSSRKL